MRYLSFLVLPAICFGLALTPSAHGSAEDPLLKEYQLTPDAAGLLQYLRALQPGKEQRAQIQTLVQQLGSEKFNEREDATRRLTVLAIVAMNDLKQAAQSHDLEVRRRAEEILERYDSVSEPILIAMLHTMRTNPPAGVVPELLRVLPALKQDHLRLAAEETLLTASRPGDAAALRQALKADAAEMRAAALTALAKAVGDRIAPDALPYLRDPDERVRLAAVRALVEHSPRECLGPLVELLAAENVAVRSGSAVLLQALTGQHHGFVAYDEPAPRREAVARWQAWLREHGATAKVNALPADFTAKTGRLLLCLFRPYRVVEVDFAGRQVFASEEFDAACGCQRLANGHCVIADWGKREVVELDAHGKAIWRKPVPGTPNCIDQLPNGNVLVGLFHEKQVCEIKRDGSVAWRATVGGQPTDTRRLPNGRTLVALFDGERVVELDADGKVVWQLTNVPTPESARRLANGNTLVASSRSGQVLEYSREGKLVWSVKNLPSPYDALELDNGHVLIGYERGLREVERSGKVVRDLGVGIVRRIARY